MSLVGGPKPFLEATHFNRKYDSPRFRGSREAEYLLHQDGLGILANERSHFFITQQI